MFKVLVPTADLKKQEAMNAKIAVRCMSQKN